MHKARIANPGPAALMVINSGRKTMATKKRRSTKRRTTTARRPNTTAATHHKKRRSTRRPTVHASHHRKVTRRVNPSRRKRYVRNPLGGLLSKAVGLAGGIAAVGVLQQFVPPIGGASVFAVAGRQAAIGWGAGELMKRFGIFRNYADEVKLAGVALGVGTLINAFLLPTISGFLRPAAPAPKKAGMNDIVTLPRGSYDSYYGSTPQFNTNPGSGMNDIVTLPRRQYGY